MNPWDQRFQTDDYVFGTEPAKALVRLESYLVPGGKTLVVADGEGRNSVYLASKGFDVTATDYSEVGLAKARRLAEERGVAVEYVDLSRFDAAPITHLSYLSFEGQGAFPAEG